MMEFLTFKSGKFYFSDQYDVIQIEGLLIKATVLNETLVDLPILPEIASRIQPDIMYNSIAGTAAIEGNPITYDDVEKIAMGEELNIYTKKDLQEVKNLIKAYNLLSNIEITEKPFFLTEELICEVHKMITDDVPNEHNIPGKYRNGLVYVGDKAHGGIFTPPKILEDIKGLMKVFVEWINSEEVMTLSPFIRASLAHYYLCIIHPFWDGNGRTARLIEAIILKSANIKYVPKELSNYYYRNVDGYYNAFSKAIKLKRDTTPFLKFCLNAAVSSLERIKEIIIFFIRKFALRDFYIFEKQNKRLTARQFELLSLLLENPINFTLQDLFTKRPFSILYKKVSMQTARRDLKKLVEKNFLLVDNNKQYFLNLRILG